MTIEQCFSKIEDPGFAAVLNAASTLSVFIDIMEAESPFTQLVEEAKRDPRGVPKVFDRIRALAETPINQHYENPNDVALSAYAWAVGKIAPSLSTLVAEYIIEIPNIWWSASIASVVLKEPPIFLSKSTNAFVIGFAPFDPNIRLRITLHHGRDRTARTESRWSVVGPRDRQAAWRFVFDFHGTGTPRRAAASHGDTTWESFSLHPLPRYSHSDTQRSEGRWLN
jgi:hypothetical protein